MKKVHNRNVDNDYLEKKKRDKKRSILIKKGRKSKNEKNRPIKRR